MIKLVRLDYRLLHGQVVVLVDRPCGRTAYHRGGR